jgi:catechol 2,3-dioxygenase-like lactoylglutathione lyase family enzyme
MEISAMIDHIGMPVGDIARATEFYRKALAPLGYGVVMEVSAEETGHGAAVGFGPPGKAEDFQSGKPSFWIGEGKPLGEPRARALMRSIAPRSMRAARTTGRPGSAPTITPITTRPSSSISTATTSRP